MGFPHTSVLDDFNRGDGDLGADWQEMMRSGNDFLIDTNQCKPDGWNAEVYNPATYGPSCEVYVTLATLQAQGNLVIVYVRMKDVTADAYEYDGYGVRTYRFDDSGTDTMRIKVMRYDDSVGTQLGAAVEFTTQGDGDKLGLRAKEDILVAFYKEAAGDWEEEMQRTDATYAAAGYLAMYLPDDANVRVDDFGGGTLLPAVPILSGEGIHSLVFGGVTVR